MSAQLCAAARSGALWVREAASAARGRGRRPGRGRAQRQQQRPHHGVSGAERRDEAGGDRSSRPSSTRGGGERAVVRVRLRSSRSPLPFPPRLPPPSERALSPCHGPAGGGERAVSRRPLRDAPSRGRGGGTAGSAPSLLPLPSLSPHPGGAAAASPRPSCPGSREAANGGALPSAPASLPRPGPPRPPPFPRPLRRARPRAGRRATPLSPLLPGSGDGLPPPLGGPEDEPAAGGEDVGGCRHGGGAGVGGGDARGPPEEAGVHDPRPALPGQRGEPAGEGAGRAAPRGEALGGVTKGALPSPGAGGRGKEGRKGLPRTGGVFLGEDEGSYPGGGGAPLHAPARVAGEGLRAPEGGLGGVAGPAPPGAVSGGGLCVWRDCGMSQRSLLRYNSLQGK